MRSNVDDRSGVGDRQGRRGWRSAVQHVPVTAALVEDGQGWTFALSEPAHVYYTTDGTVPTEDSTRWMAAGIRERGETLAFPDGTTVRWLAVDPAGNAATQEATIG
jgi:hypothetical protein